MSSYIERRISNTLKAMGLGENDYLQEAVEVRITQPVIDYPIHNSFMVLLGEVIDIPFTARLTIESEDNIFITSKADYSRLEYRRMQSFSGYMTIKIENYGAVFEPFSLEFLKIDPLYNQDKK